MAAPTLIGPLTPPNSTSVDGTVTAAPGNRNRVWRGDPAWAVLAGQWETNASFTVPASGSTVAVTFVSTSGMAVGMTLAVLDSANKFFLGEVTVVTDSTHATLKHQGYAPSGTGTVATLALAWVAGPGLASSSVPGLCPAVDNTTIQVVSGKLSAVSLAYSALTGAPTLGTSAAKNIAASGNAGATEVVYGNDTRLSDSRTPTSHGSSHLSTDAIPAATSTATGLVPVPPNNTNKWYNGTSAWTYEAQATEPNGTFTVPAAGSTVAVTIVSASWPVVGQTILITDGTRIGFFEITAVTSATSITVSNRGYLGNSTSGTMATGSTVRLMGPGIATATQPGFVPTPDNTVTHFLNGQMGFTAVTYGALGGTPPALDAVSAPTDITTLNASTSAHGLMPKGTASTTTFYRSDLTQATPPTVTRSAAGYAPASGGASGTTNFLREDLSWAAPAGSSAGNNTATTTASFSMPAVGSTVTVAATNSTNIGKYATVYVPGGGIMVQKGAPSGGNLTLLNPPNQIANVAATTSVPAATVTVVNDGRADLFLNPRNHFADDHPSINIQTANSGGWSDVTGVADHPGIKAFSTNALATGASWFQPNESSTEYVLSTTSRAAVRFVFQMTSPILVVTTQGGKVSMGLCFNNVFSAVGQGMWIEWDPGVNSSRWVLKCANGGTVSTSNGTMTAPVASTWYEAILMFDGTTVNGSIGPWNGTLVAFTGLTTNLPTTAGVGVTAGIAKATGTTSSTVWFDLWEVAYLNSQGYTWLGASMLP